MNCHIVLVRPVNARKYQHLHVQKDAVVAKTYPNVTDYEGSRLSARPVTSPTVDFPINSCGTCKQHLFRNASGLRQVKLLIFCAESTTLPRILDIRARNLLRLSVKDEHKHTYKMLCSHPHPSTMGSRLTTGLCLYQRRRPFY